MKTAAGRVLDNLKNTIFPKGSIATIRLGQLRGYRYPVSDNSGWAPIVGRWEPGAQQLFSRIIRLGETVFDLGANSGLHSILFSKLVGPDGHVYSFEPLPENIREVEHAVEINKLRNLEIVKAAVSDTCGSAMFNLGVHNKQGSLERSLGKESRYTKSTISVNVTTLDSFIEKRSIIPDFIKIDIEGAEGSALIGCRSSLERFQPLLSIELHSPDQDVLVGTILTELGYELYRFDPSSRRDVKLVRIKFPVVGWPNRDGTWGTVLAIPGKHSERIRDLGIGKE